MDRYEPYELFVYTRDGDCRHMELGMVKGPNNTGDGYFCWYSRGDTAANTPIRCMRKLSNAGWTKSVIVSAITDILASGKFIASFDDNKQDRKDEYIGARRVPIFATPKQWSRDRAYEHLMMVEDQGNTYISKQAVPVGIDLPTTSGENDYWLLTSNWKVVDDA